MQSSTSNAADANQHMLLSNKAAKAQKREERQKGVGVQNIEEGGFRDDNLVIFSLVIILFNQFKLALFDYFLPNRLLGLLKMRLFYHRHVFGRAIEQSIVSHLSSTTSITLSSPASCPSCTGISPFFV